MNSLAFTNVGTLQNNCKAERVIRALIDIWHNKKKYLNGTEDRCTQLRIFLNFYNYVKSHKGIYNLTPYEKLEFYFSNYKQHYEI